MKHTLSVGVIVFAIFGCWYGTASAVYNASDALGQLDGLDTINFTRSLANDNPSDHGLFYPHSAIVDTQRHRLFVADASNHRVLVFNLDSSNTPIDHFADYVLGQPDTHTVSGGTTQSKMRQPLGLAIDVSGGRLFVADSLNNRVLVYDVTSVSNGQNASNVIGQAGFGTSVAATTQTGMDTPAGLSYDALHNKLYVPDYNNHRVLIFSTSSISDGMAAANVLGQTLFTTKVPHTTQSTMRNPHRVFIDATNNRLFVADISNNRVLTFDASAVTNGMNASNVLGQASFVASASATTAAGMHGPAGITYDNSASRLFVSDHYNNRVLVYDLTSLSDGQSATNVLGQTGFAGVASGSGQASMSGPEELSIDTTNHHLYVPENFNHTVLVYDISSIANGQNAIDALGHVDSTGQPDYTNIIANDSPSGRGLSSPHSVALDTVHHRLFVVDASNNRVLQYDLDSNNTLLDHVADHVIGQPDMHTVTSGFTQAKMTLPLAVGYDDVGDRLFVADFSANRVLVYNTSVITDGMNAANVLGQTNFSNNGTSTASTGANLPVGIAVDGTGHRLFVSDYGNNRVLVYDITTISNGQAATHVLGQTAFGTGAASLSQTRLDGPYGIFFDPATQSLYVPDFNNHRVMIWDVTTVSDGQAAVHVLGQSGFSTKVNTTTQSGMDSPTSVVKDSESGRLFVSDYNNQRVLVFDGTAITDGMNALGVLGQTDFVSKVQATSQSGMMFTLKLAYDSTLKRLYDPSNVSNRVLIFNFVRIATGSLTGATAQQSYSQSIATANSQGTVSLSVTAGSLPPGVSISGTSLTGTPTSPGTYSFTVRASDNNGNNGIYLDDQAYTLTVAGAPSGGGLPPAAFVPPPLVTVSAPATTTTGAVTLSLTVSGSGTAPSTMAVSLNADFAGAGQEPYASTRAVTLCTTTCIPGTVYHVYVKVYTSWGQVSSPVSVAVTYTGRSAGGSPTLKEGDVISASGSSDPDVYIINAQGYKRLFLNPVIFGFYGHLTGGFSGVKNVTPLVRDSFGTSGLFRNCETSDQAVWGIEVTGEDTGILHHIALTGAQVVAQDPNFFKKVFCINSLEQAWYPIGDAWTSLTQVPDYRR